jgi:hypothetical protein
VNLPSLPEARRESGTPLKGVTGWLLVLCITLTFIAPLVQGRIGLIALTNFSRTHLVNILTTARLLAVGFTYLGLSIFSLCAGVTLWREDPRGPTVAKFYLWFSAALVISLYLVLYLTGVHTKLAQIIFQRLVYSITWYAYLTFSKRVREVYSRAS